VRTPGAVAAGWKACPTERGAAIRPRVTREKSSLVFARRLRNRPAGVEAHRTNVVHNGGYPMQLGPNDNRMEAQKLKQQEFLDLAERLRRATDAEEIHRLGEQMGRMVFGNRFLAGAARLGVLKNSRGGLVPMGPLSCEGRAGPGGPAADGGVRPTNANRLYEISTTVWKIAAGNCMPDERRRS
jgi:hypothetical protein